MAFRRPWNRAPDLFSGTDRKWLVLLAIALPAMLLTYWPQGLPAWCYDRTLIASGAGWRLLTAHFVHINGFHLLLNLLGLLLLCELLWGRLSIRHGLGLLGAGAAAVVALLWWRAPEVAWYAGLSGALHALWIGCALSGLTRNSPGSVSRHDVARWVCVAALVLLVVKLALELELTSGLTSGLTAGLTSAMNAGPLELIAGVVMEGTGTAVQPALVSGAVLPIGESNAAFASPGLSIGAPVVTESHRYGALGGALYWLLWRLWDLISRRRAVA